MSPRQRGVAAPGSSLSPAAIRKKNVLADIEGMSRARRTTVKDDLSNAPPADYAGHWPITAVVVGMLSALRLMTLVRLRPAAVARLGSDPVPMPKPVGTRTSA